MAASAPPPLATPYGVPTGCALSDRVRELRLEPGPFGLPALRVGWLFMACYFPLVAGRRSALSGVLG